MKQMESRQCDNPQITRSEREVTGPIPFPYTDIEYKVTSGGTSQKIMDSMVFGSPYNSVATTIFDKSGNSVAEQLVANKGEFKSTTAKFDGHTYLYISELPSAYHDKQGFYKDGRKAAVTDPAEIAAVKKYFDTLDFTEPPCHR
jgi:hypothetical protein